MGCRSADSGTQAKVQLTEDLGEVRTVDFVNDEEVRVLESSRAFSAIVINGPCFSANTGCPASLSSGR